MNIDLLYTLSPAVLAIALAVNNKRNGKRIVSYTSIVALFVFGIVGSILPHNQTSTSIMFAFGGITAALLIANLTHPNMKRFLLNVTCFAVAVSAFLPTTAFAVQEPLCPASESRFLYEDNLVGFDLNKTLISGSVIVTTKIISTEDNSLQGFFYTDENGLQWVGLLQSAKDHVKAYYPGAVMRGSTSPFPISAFRHPSSSPLPPRTRLIHCGG